MDDLRDIIQFKLASLQKEETTFREKLEKMNKDKFDHLRELQR